MAMRLQVSFYSPCSALPSQASDGRRTSANYTHLIGKLVSIDEGTANEFRARPRKGLTALPPSASPVHSMFRFHHARWAGSEWLVGLCAVGDESTGKDLG